MVVAEKADASGPISFGLQRFSHSLPLTSNSTVFAADSLKLSSSVFSVAVVHSTVRSSSAWIKQAPTPATEPPSGSNAVTMGVGLSADASDALGLDGEATLVEDSAGNCGIALSGGVSGGLELDASVGGVLSFTLGTIHDLSGKGYSISADVHVIGGLGVTALFDDKGQFAGVEVSGSIGLGVNIFSGSFGYEYVMPLSRRVFGVLCEVVFGLADPFTPFELATSNKDLGGYYGLLNWAQSQMGQSKATAAGA
jgi:hypothetical protein